MFVYSYSIYMDILATQGSVERILSTVYKNMSKRYQKFYQMLQLMG